MKISLKLRYFCKKMQIFLCTGGSAPRPPCLQRLGASPLDPQLPVDEGFAPRPKKHPPITNFGLRAWYFYCCYVILCKLILQLAGVYGFPQAALSLNKFAHPWVMLIDVAWWQCLGNCNNVFIPLQFPWPPQREGSLFKSCCLGTSPPIYSTVNEDSHRFLFLFFIIIFIAERQALMGFFLRQIAKSRIYYETLQEFFCKCLERKYWNSIFFVSPQV